MMTTDNNTSTSNEELEKAGKVEAVEKCVSELNDEVVSKSEYNQQQEQQETFSSIATETKKKRTAERQIVKGEHETSDDENRASNEPFSETQAFPKASVEELKRRRIVKVKTSRQPPESSVAATEGQQPPQPILKVQVEGKKDEKNVDPSSNNIKPKILQPLTGKESVTSTSGFVKFSAVNPFQFPLSNAKTFNFGNPSDTSNSNVGGFGTTIINSSGFGSILSSASANATTGGFGSLAAINSEGSEKEQNGAKISRDEYDNKFSEQHGTEEANNVSAKAVFSLPSEVEEFNGEENEVCVMQLRAKLYRLCGNNMQTLQHQEEDRKEDNHDDNNENTATETSSAATLEQDLTVFSWKETGTGPLRILQQRQLPPKDVEQNSRNTSTRVVQRRESTPGGQGTKVILNIPIRRETVVHRQGDKHVMISTVSCEVR